MFFTTSENRTLRKLNVALSGPHPSLTPLTAYMNMLVPLSVTGGSLSSRRLHEKIPKPAPQADNLQPLDESVGGKIMDRFLKLAPVIHQTYTDPQRKCKSPPKLKRSQRDDDSVDEPRKRARPDAPTQKRARDGTLPESGERPQKCPRRESQKDKTDNLPVSATRTRFDYPTSIDLCGQARAVRDEQENPTIGVEDQNPSQDQEWFPTWGKCWRPSAIQVSMLSTAPGFILVGDPRGAYYPSLMLIAEMFHTLRDALLARR